MRILLVFIALGMSVLFSNLGQASTRYLVEQILDPSTQTTDLSGFVAEAQKSDLISIGETHDSGLERVFLKTVYENLFPSLFTKPVCLVEDFENLFQKQDIVRPLIESGCGTIQTVPGNSPVGTAFTPFLKPMFRQREIVLTHSGFRHIMPMGRYFASDFDPTPVDLLPQNTISTQLPKKFEGKQMTTMTVLGYEELFEHFLKTELMNIEGKSPEKTVQSLNEVTVKLQNLFEAGEKIFIPATGARIFYVKTLQMSHPHRSSFLALIHHHLLQEETMTRFLATSELVSFLRSKKSNTKLYVTIPYTNMGFAKTLLVKPGGILIFGGKDYMAIQPDGRVEIGLQKLNSIFRHNDFAEHEIQY